MDNKVRVTLVQELPLPLVMGNALEEISEHATNNSMGLC